MNIKINEEHFSQIAVESVPCNIIEKAVIKAIGKSISYIMNTASFGVALYKKKLCLFGSAAYECVYKSGGDETDFLDKQYSPKMLFIELTKDKLNLLESVAEIEDFANGLLNACKNARKNIP